MRINPHRLELISYTIIFTSMKNLHDNITTFRSATQHDLNNLLDLVHAAYRGEASRQGWTTEADIIDGTRTDIQELADIINATNNVILLCENNSRMIASVHIQKQGDVTYLGMFAVHPSVQNSGIGKALLAAAEHHALELWHSRCVQMTVITLRTELIAWYQRRGYQATGIYKPFPYGIARYGNPKRVDLLLEVLEKNLN